MKTVFLPRGLAAAALLTLTLAGTALLRGAAPVAYRLTFPNPEHHWMQVEATFSELDAAPLELRMSRSSPGRYSLHDFAKNVYDVEATGSDGRRLTVTRPDPARMDGPRASVDRRREIQGVWRSCRRHISRHRSHARPHEHAGVGDVRARAR